MPVCKANFVIIFILLIGAVAIEEKKSFHSAVIEKHRNLEVEHHPFGALRLPGVLSSEACRMLIVAGESFGFSKQVDSIDGLPGEEIYILDDGEVLLPSFYALISDHLDGLKRQLDTLAPNAPNKVGWVFLRRYASNTNRFKLQGHLDTNARTATILLNSDFTGGEFWFGNSLKACVGQKKRRCRQRSVKFGNRADGHIPEGLAPGDAIIYESGLYHGILPVTSGVRYSLVVFYDMPAKESEPIQVVEFRNNLAVPAVLAWLENPHAASLSESGMNLISKSWGPGETTMDGTYPGHVYAALLKDNYSHILQRWEISADTKTVTLGEKGAFVSDDL